MTKTKLILLFVSILLLTASCYAVDLNAMTPDELQDYVAAMQNQIDNPKPIQPTVITIQADTQLNEKIDLLQKELADVKASMNQMQERFNRLATDTSEVIQSGNNEVVTLIDGKMKEQLVLLYDETTAYIDLRTNPIRQTAPAVGAFLILAGAFLLWASRQYKLTGGNKNG